jgi:AhpD family alkylhydroperoxidase
MEQRLSLDTSPQAREALRGLERYLSGTELPKALVELVKLRVSMINGCAFCIDMHFRALRESGQDEMRLYGLSAWREQRGYSPSERAALAWAESVTLVDRTHVPDDVYQEARAHFSAKDLADLTFVVVAINSWNRLCVAFRIQPPEREKP